MQEMNMPYQWLDDGLYLISQQSQDKGVRHYGILDVGNRLAHPSVDGRQPIVVHQTPPTIRIDWLQNTGEWNVEGRITDEVDAIGRMNKAFRNPSYSLFGNNCEHFARYVATGKHESTQVQAVTFIAGLAVLAYVVTRE